MTKDTRIYKRKDSTAWRSLSDQGVILNLKTNEIFGLNGTAIRIWELLENRPKIDDIAKCLSVEYCVNIDDAQKDARQFLAELENRGLVESIA